MSFKDSEFVVLPVHGKWAQGLKPHPLYPSEQKNALGNLTNGEIPSGIQYVVDIDNMQIAGSFLLKPHATAHITVSTMRVDKNGENVMQVVYTTDYPTYMSTKQAFQLNPGVKYWFRVYNMTDGEIQAAYAKTGLAPVPPAANWAIDTVTFQAFGSMIEDTGVGVNKLYWKEISALAMYNGTYPAEGGGSKLVIDLSGNPGKALLGETCDPDPMTFVVRGWQTPSDVESAVTRVPAGDGVTMKQVFAEILSPPKQAGTEVPVRIMQVKEMPRSIVSVAGMTIHTLD
jgi:hypothetical protein